MAPAAAWDWPLVGRTLELELIDRLRRAGAAGVVLAGAPGVGKSRLAREAAVGAERAGQVACWIQATASAASVPLGAFAGEIPERVDNGDPLLLMRLIRESLAERAHGREVALAVDDAHLLDDASAALVLQTARAGEAFVVATIRTGEPTPDAIVSLWKDAGLHRLELDALDQPETEALAERIVGGAIEQQARRWIFDTSLGNALYVRELVLGARDGGALTEVSGLWRMPVRPPVNGSLTELVTARMTGLAEEEQRTLELLALGEPLRISEIVSAVGEEAPSRMEARGLITVQGGAATAEALLAHPVYAEVIRASLPAIRGRQVRLALASIVSQRGSAEAADVLRTARWLIDAGEELPGALALAAARAANLAGDPGLAAQLASAAMARGAGVEAALLLARAHTIQNRPAEAAAVLSAAEAAIDDRESALEYLEQQADVLYLGLRRPGELRRLMERARDWWPDAAWRRRVDALALVGDAPVGPDAVQSVELLADPDDPELRRQMGPLRAARLFYAGRTREAAELARAIRPSPPLRDLIDELSFMLWTSIALETGEGWVELEAWATGALSDGVRLGDRAAAGLAALALGGIAFSRGRFVDARRWLAESELQLEHHDSGNLLAITTSMQVGVACFTGDVDGIAPALARCHAAVGDAPPLPSHRAYVVRAGAWAANAEGDAPQAQRMFLNGAEQLSDMPIFAARLTYEAMRAGAPARRLAPLLADLSERCDARLTAAYAAHGAARSHDDGRALLQVSEEMESIGALRYASEAAAHAAEAFARVGRTDSARRAVMRSRELHGRGQDGIAPIIEGVDGAEVSLTRRERQLVDLAARGLTNLDIADRLVLSVRTVESHLYRAMQKLGVSDRRDL